MRLKFSEGRVDATFGRDMLLSSVHLMSSSLSLAVLQLCARRERGELDAERRRFAQSLAGYRTVAALDRDARGRLLPRPRGAPPSEPWRSRGWRCNLSPQSEGIP
jgi:hypothetical protein